MDDIESHLFERLSAVLLTIIDRRLRTDKDFTEELLVNRKGNAIGGGWVVEELFVEGGDSGFTHEIDRDLPAVDLLMSENRLHQSADGGSRDLQIFLPVREMNSNQVVKQLESLEGQSPWYSFL